MVIQTQWTVTCDSCDTSQFQAYDLSYDAVAPSLDDFAAAAPEGWTARRYRRHMMMRCPKCAQ